MVGWSERGAAASRCTHLSCPRFPLSSCVSVSFETRALLSSGTWRVRPALTVYVPRRQNLRPAGLLPRGRPPYMLPCWLFLRVFAEPLDLLADTSPTYLARASESGTSIACEQHASATAGRPIPSLRPPRRYLLLSMSGRATDVGRRQLRA